MGDLSVYRQAVLALGGVIDVERLRELERFATLGKISASMLHEINNPLAAALLYLDQNSKQQPANIGQVRKSIKLLQRYVNAARQQVQGESKVAGFYVRPQIDQIRQVLLPLAQHSGVKLRIELASNYKLIGDAVKFQQIITNLISNAIDAYCDCPPTAAVKLVTIHLISQQQWLIVRVSDNARGIPPDQLPKIFEPFYSTKNQGGRGLGLGLALVKQYVEDDFYGSIKVVSAVHRGSEFTAKLRLTPRYQK
jgi:signal transduction histidine kinase